VALAKAIGAIAALFYLGLGFAYAQRPAEPILRVQLLWSHQAQFAGFYVAQARKHFEAEGLDVILYPGGPGINPITELQEGRVDIAVSWLSNAWGLTNVQHSVTNVAQIFSGSSLTVICRISAGVFSAKDMVGKTVGVWNLGDEHVVREMLHRLSIPNESVRLELQRANGRDLIEGVMPCVTAMTYNEYWQILQAGISPEDLIVISPETFGIPHVEDGLYVLNDRLESLQFQDQLARFVKAVRQGWHETRVAPTLVIETVQRLSPAINKEHQRHMLETVLSMTPEKPSQFGLFNLGRYRQSMQTLLTHGAVQEEPENMWTHRVWNRIEEIDKRETPLTTATRFYASDVLQLPEFKLFIIFGVLTFALSGVLEAINRGYDLWGRLVLAFVSGLGGGTLRDFLIGEERLPLYYVSDLTFPAGILGIVLLATGVTARHENIHKTDSFKSIKKYADIIGFAVLAITGALIATASSLAWYWAPICAALTCAGGGMLRDIVINQEPQTFKGVIYEEVAVIGALVLIGCLMLANLFEHTGVPVYASIAAGILSIILFRIAIYSYNIRYPRFLGGARVGQQS
jgi:NitT/TauT family transport system substrate-binding protein